MISSATMAASNAATTGSPVKNRQAIEQGGWAAGLK
jgi:hypothetical protein